MLTASLEFRLLSNNTRVPMSNAYAHRVAGVVLACILIAAPRTAGAQQPPAGQAAPADQAAIIRGVVLDRADGSPIADVSVRLQDDKLTVKTDDAGRFELTGVPPGRRCHRAGMDGSPLARIAQPDRAVVRARLGSRTLQFPAGPDCGDPSPRGL
jgi:hypothetical protein